MSYKKMFFLFEFIDCCVMVFVQAAYGMKRLIS